jgi:hypothetical protein
LISRASPLSAGGWLRTSATVCSCGMVITFLSSAAKSLIRSQPGSGPLRTYSTTPFCGTWLYFRQRRIAVKRADRRPTWSRRTANGGRVSLSQECHNSCATPTNASERPRMIHVAAQRKLHTDEYRRAGWYRLKIRPVSVRVRLGAPYRASSRVLLGLTAAILAACAVMWWWGMSVRRADGEPGR